MEFNGKINVREVERVPFEIKSTQTEKWVRRLLERAAPEPDVSGHSAEEWAKLAKLTTEVRLEKFSSDYLLTGSLEGSVPSRCSGCGDGFEPNRKASFKLVLHPVYAGRDGKMAKDDDDGGDPDYVLLNSDEIDIAEQVAEVLISQEPVAECPKRDASGICSQCGINPETLIQGWNSKNIVELDEKPSVEAKTLNPFAKLKDLKLTKK